jgi:ribose transport system ATP-binding protein
MITLADRILVMRDFSLVGEIENSRRYEPMSREIMSLIHGVAEERGRDPAREAAHG